MDAIEVLETPTLHPVGESLERIDGIGHTIVVRNDLLRAQRDGRRLEEDEVGGIFGRSRPPATTPLPLHSVPLLYTLTRDREVQ